MINLKFYKDIQKRKSQLELRIKLLGQYINNSPKGSLRTSKEHGIPRYYTKQSSTQKAWTYINDTSLIIKLKNKSNAIKAMKETQKELTQINNILSNQADTKITNLFHNITIGKHTYPVQNFMELMKNTYISNWLSIPYEKKPFPQYGPKHYSMSGKEVRSKSEGKIYDCLEHRNIPFVYEFPVKIDGINYHPDFKCLNPRTLEVIYWEHWGTMDDPSYVNKQLKKLEAYRKAGIILGKNLFVTIETKDKPLIPETIFQFIDDHLS